MTKLIGTHNGHFHCDEALAVHMLLQTKEFKEAELIRTRDAAKLDTCDIVVDVGGVYDTTKHRYDHHQRGFTEVFGGKFDTKLSSAGLVYKHFGKEIIASILSLDETDAQVELLYNKVYENFVEALDGGDNGISQYPSDIKPKYRVGTALPQRVAGLNPWWNQKDIDVDAQFMKAVAMTGQDFTDAIRYLGLSWWPARDLVVKALEGRTDIHPSGKILVFDQSCPWKEHLFKLEEELQVEEKPLYVLYPDESGNWRIQCVPPSPESFDCRKHLPQEWRGFRDDELSERSGIPNSIFVHMSGFIGGNKTREGALEMAVKAIEA
ncbi:hypothetical protein BGW38_000809 [Lunasporangiospora selenospora]|uniref:Uncharacterized protein n=1 Tax=Lunasporangiospora selenospora TaxID=979761 RepID=A0A9P6FVK0_9FUNG|nr:hypothetical protein BGW38_000809 [Lunasporangiospora selenospora]